MKSSISSLIITIVVLILGMVILPIYIKSMVNSRDDAVRVQNAVRNFIDICIDNQKIPEEAIADFNLELAACTASYTYTLYRDKKVVSPDGKGGFVVTWVTVEVHPGDTLVQGDFIIVEAKQDSLSIFQRLSSILNSTSYNGGKTRLSGMVR